MQDYSYTSARARAECQVSVKDYPSPYPKGRMRAEAYRAHSFMARATRHDIELDNGMAFYRPRAGAEYVLRAYRKSSGLGRTGNPYVLRD